MTSTLPIQVQLKTSRLGNGYQRELKSKDLGFGRIFSDHMACLNFSKTKGWFDARIVPYAPISLDPGAAVFHYGQAMFEGLKAFRGVDHKVRFFRPQFHCNRMAIGAERLCMPSISSEMMLALATELVKVESAWVPNERGTSLYLRPTLIGTEPFLGVRPSDEYLFFIIASPVGAYYSEGANPVKIWVESEYSRAGRGGLGSVKAGANYASSLLASSRAKKAGYAQVLWLDANERNWIEEVGTMNVFFVFGDKIVTPPLGGTILNGATRDSTLMLLKSWGYKVEERPIAMEEIIKGITTGELKESFGTGTAAVISPIGEFNFRDKPYVLQTPKSDGVSQRLYRTITEIQYGEAEDPFKWTIEIPL